MIKNLFLSIFVNSCHLKIMKNFISFSTISWDLFAPTQGGIDIFLWCYWDIRIILLWWWISSN